MGLIGIKSISTEIGNIDILPFVHKNLKNVVCINITLLMAFYAISPSADLCLEFFTVLKKNANDSETVYRLVCTNFGSTKIYCKTTNNLDAVLQFVKQIRTIVSYFRDNTIDTLAMFILYCKCIKYSAIERHIKRNCIDIKEVMKKARSLM
jgi:hypothetical protein